MEILTLRTIPVSAISCDRTWSLHGDLSGSPGPELVRSIEQFGIIHPPITRQDETGSLEIVCGAYRFAAAAEVLHQKELASFIVPASMQVADLLRLLLEDQRLSGPLSPIEKARFVALCRTHLDEAASRDFERESGLGSRRLLDHYLELLKLDAEVRSAIHRGLISEQTGRELIGCKVCDRDFLPNLFVHLGLNRNKQRKFLEAGRVIMALEGKESFAELFREHFPEYLEQAEIPNPPQAAHLLLREMERLSKPLLSRAEELFNTQCAALKLPGSCTLVHAKSFEQEEVTLQIRFRDLEEFRQRWRDLKGSLDEDSSL
jgi:ParB-like chromosome segregation protein Spo0J